MAFLCSSLMCCFSIWALLISLNRERHKSPLTLIRPVGAGMKRIMISRMSINASFSSTSISPFFFFFSYTSALYLAVFSFYSTHLVLLISSISQLNRSRHFCYRLMYFFLFLTYVSGKHFTSSWTNAHLIVFSIWLIDCFMCYLFFKSYVYYIFIFYHIFY